MNTGKLLASSATADGLVGLISRFYGHEDGVTLEADGTVHKNGHACPGVRWRLKGKRYRFEMIEDNDNA